MREDGRGEQNGFGSVSGGGGGAVVLGEDAAGTLAEAMPRIREELARAENAVIESNSILRFLAPDLYLSVLDPAVEDFKESARYFLDRADAVLVPEGVLGGLCGECFVEAGGGTPC